MKEQGHDIAMEAAKASPAAAVSLAATVGGLSLNDWVLVSTLVYIFLQMGWLVLKAYWAMRDRRERRDEERIDSERGDVDGGW